MFVWTVLLKLLLSVHTSTDFTQTQLSHSVDVNTGALDIFIFLPPGLDCNLMDITICLKSQYICYYQLYFSLMYHTFGLLHNLTAPPLIGPLPVRFTSPENGQITGLTTTTVPGAHLSTGAAPPMFDPRGGEMGKG